MINYKKLKQKVWDVMLNAGFNILTDIKFNTSNFGFTITKGFNEIFTCNLDYNTSDNQIEQLVSAVSLAIDKFNHYNYWSFFRGVKVYKNGVFQCQTVKTLDELGENYHFDYTTNSIVYDKPITIIE